MHKKKNLIFSHFFIFYFCVSLSSKKLVERKRSNVGFTFHIFVQRENRPKNKSESNQLKTHLEDTHHNLDFVGETFTVNKKRKRFVGFRDCEFN